MSKGPPPFFLLGKRKTRRLRVCCAMETESFNSTRGFSWVVERKERTKNKSREEEKKMLFKKFF